MTVIDTPAGIAYAQLLARRGALRLETLGMRRSGRSAFSICKEVYGLKGSKAKVLEQMDALVEKSLADRAAGIV